MSKIAAGVRGEAIEERRPAGVHHAAHGPLPLRREAGEAERGLEDEKHEGHGPHDEGRGSQGGSPARAHGPTVSFTAGTPVSGHVKSAR